MIGELGAFSARETKHFINSHRARLGKRTEYHHVFDAEHFRRHLTQVTE